MKGPFLVMIVAGEYPEAHGYAPLRAFAQPIYSGRRFIPVNSEFERDVLRALLEARRELAEEGLDIFVEKPVFDHVWTTSAAQELFGIDDLGRVHPCVRPVRAAPHGCWP